MTSLTSSKKPREQRKARYEAPLHMRHCLMAVHLAKELREKLKTKRRNLPVREGDRVKIMKGEHRGKSGKVTNVDIGRGKVFVEGVVIKRGKGGEAFIPIEPSNLMLIEADMSDKMRNRILERSKKVE